MSTFSHAAPGKANENGSYERESSERQRMNRGDISQDVLEVLRARGPLTRFDIALATGRGERQIDNTVQHLRRMGRIRRADGRQGPGGPGRRALWEIAPPGMPRPALLRRATAKAPASTGASLPPAPRRGFAMCIRHREEKIAVLERVVEGRFLTPRGRDLLCGIINDYRREGAA